MMPFDPSKSLRPLEQPFWLPTGTFVNIMSPKVAWRKHLGFLKTRFVPLEEPHILVPGEIIPSVAPLAEHPTVRLVAEIAQGVEPFETTMWRDILEGEPVARRFPDGVKAPMRERRHFSDYADRIKRFLAFAEANGIRPIVETRGQRIADYEHDDVDIGFAVLEDGIYFYRKGRHRLGCARALGIEWVPCQCYFVSQRAVDRITATLPDGRAKADWRAVIVTWLGQVGARDSAPSENAKPHDTLVSS